MNKSKRIIIEESNFLPINAPATVTICGDIHSQFVDLMELFKTESSCPQINYLIMDDFVERGCNSVETFLLFLTLTILFPACRTLIRGNHQSRQIAQVYGFYDEYNRNMVQKRIGIFYRNF